MDFIESLPQRWPRRASRLDSRALSARHARPREFDGTHLYEHSAPARRASRLGHPRLQLRRNEVQNYLDLQCFILARQISLDGLRVTPWPPAVSRLFGAKPEVGPQSIRRRENLPAIAFLRRLNEVPMSLPGLLTNRRRIHCVAQRFPSHVSRRPRL